MFERFWQGEDGSGREHGGLGLAIVRHLVESHGGEVQAHSDGVGCGALFVVTLPLMATTEHTKVAACGAEVRVAASTRQALAILDRWPPDVIVSDIGMPGEDGYALIEQVRARGAADGGDVPAIALTAYARVEDRVAVLTAGFQMHVTKPIDPVELVAVVASLARRPPRREAGGARHEGAP